MNETTERGLEPAARDALALEFRIERRAELPPMAWALKLVRGERLVHVLAGNDVRAADGVFWEGVNPCTDTPRDVVNHHFPLCSGAAIERGALIAFTPGHTLDRVFTLRRDDAIYVSNSLPFLLKAGSAQLEPRRLNYHWYLGAIGAHRQTVPVEGGALDVFANTNVVIGADFYIRQEVRPPSPDFTNYAEYRAQLDAFLEAAAAAAAHPVNLTYKALTTISSGYDSPAASVLARLAGARTALTVVDARAGGSDSGADIAGVLGLDVETITRSDYRAFGFEAERLFYFGAVGSDIIFYPWKQRLRGALLFSGYKGDILWDRAWPRPLGTWSYDADGATMQEFRLRSGFVHLPPAYFGWRRAGRLLAISKSEEMAPWSLFTDYDRPIARRIVEEAGVPRAWFGQAKKMVTSTIGVDRGRYITIDDLGLSQAFRDALSAHRAQAAGAGLTTSFLFNNSMHNLMRTAHRAAHAVRRAVSRPPRAAGGGARRKASLKDRIFFELEFQLPARRMYMTPFNDLNFAAQVANAALAKDYVAF